MPSFGLFPLLALLLASTKGVVAQEATPGPGKFFFMWPTQVSQCQLVNLTWGAGAVAPFQAWVVPIGGQPFIYQIPASAYRNGQGAYQIQVQLNQGTNYVMLMSDARGIGSGGTSALQIVGSSPNTACLNTASRNQTAKAFSYSVAGRAQQCQPGFELQWDGTAENAPYNFTVIPLTQAYYPFDVAIDDTSGYSSDWVVNMTSGTRFTVLMNNKNQYGSGGAAGIYEVANTNKTSSSCITQSVQGTGAWPVGVATNTLPVATNPAQTPRSNNNGITGGAIAGIVIGVLAALALIGGMVWFLLRRKRRADTAGGRGDRGKANELDLADDRTDVGDGDGDDDRGMGGYTDSQVGATPFVSPYPTSTTSGSMGGRYSAVPLDDGNGHYGAGAGVGEEMSERGTMTSAGFAGLGVGFARGRDSRLSTGDMGDEGPGRAGPLPSKYPIIGAGIGSSNTSGMSGNRLPSPGALSPASIPINPSNPLSPIEPAEKRNREQQYPLPLPPGAAQNGGGGGRGMRVVNHDRPEDVPAMSGDNGREGGIGGSGGRRRERDMMDRQPQFRRHEDAGRVDIVDLPPLYTDVPREAGDRELEEGDVGERTPLTPPPDSGDLRGSPAGHGGWTANGR